MLKKIVCFILVTIILITFCCAYSSRDILYDSTISLPQTVIDCADQYDSYFICYANDSNWCPYNLEAVSNNKYVIFANSVNLSADLNFTYSYCAIYNFNGELYKEYIFDNLYTNRSAGNNNSFTIISYKNATFNNNIISDDFFVSDSEIEEDKEYQSGVLGWFQRLFDKIADIPSAILNGLKDLFIPSDDYFETWFEKIKSNFNLLFDVVEIFDEVIDQIRIASDDPDMSAITVNMASEESSNYNYGNAQVALLDLSWYKRYKPYGDAVITCFVYLFFFFRLKAELPNILHGAGEIVRTEEFNHARIEKQNEINANRELWNKRAEQRAQRQDEYMKKREEYMASKKEYYDSKLKKGNK